ncbi:MAG: transposase [bacterium]
MQTFKDKQQQLFKWDHLAEETRRRLGADWCGVWQREIIPMINERLFSGMYCADDGRPAKATADMVGILILKDFEDLTDEETVRRFAYGLDWQYALDVALADAYVAERTLQYFRADMIENAAHRAAFTDMTDRIIAKLEILTGMQRKDSSHLLSNMKKLRRLELFVETISLFLRELRKEKPGRYEGLPEEIRKRYIEREKGSFGDARSSEARRRLEQCAADAWLLLETFRKSKRARSLDGYRLLRRLFREQCEVETGDKIVVRDDVSCDSLQSPHDEGAGYSAHKGKGYQAQIVETCDAANDVQIITHVAVESAAASDADAIVPAVEALEERGLKPEEIIADTAYCGGDNDVALRDMGVALVGPAAGAEPARPDPIAAFETTPDLKSVVRCPRGAEPVRVEHTKRGDTVVALFDKETCRACDMRGACGAKRHKKHYTLTFTRSRMATALRREHEKTEAFKKTYAIRAGIEGTNSELKRAHGMGRLRVRGQPAVEFAVFMKVIACNMKRYIKARMERLRRAAGGGEVAGTAPCGVENAPCSVLAPVFRLLRLRLHHSAPLAA